MQTIWILLHFKQGEINILQIICIAKDKIQQAR